MQTETPVVPLTAEQVITDTVNFYEADPSRRAVVRGPCIYLTTDGRRCAVGRYMRPGPWQTSLGDYCALMDDCRENHEGSPLVPEATHLPDGLWLGLQEYHDGGTAGSAVDWPSPGVRRDLITDLWQAHCAAPMPDFKFHGEEP